jgi:uncharacterized protein HemX
MPNINSNIQLFIIAFLVALLLSVGIYSRILLSQNKTLTVDLNTTNSLLEVEKAKNVNLNASIKNQNEKIENNQIDLDTKLKELEEWKNKPAEIKYKEIIKFKEIKSNECTDIKNIIDSIRTTSF